MAKERVYKVVIDGEEYVSSAAKDAGEGMDKFTEKGPRWIKSFVDLKAAWDVVVGAGRALYGMARESLDAFDEYRASLQKLEGTAKITGIPLAELQELSAAAKREFGLSTPIANDLATAVANLSLRAGGAVDKQQLLNSVLDLGAARGLNATEALESFERAIMGIDAGFDKLYGKNQSVIFQEYATEIGTTVGKLTDMQKGLALVWFTLESGEKTAGQYATWLESSAGQQFMFTKRLDEAKVAFGGLVSPVRDVVVKGLNQFMDAMDFGKGSTEQLTAALVHIAKVLVDNLLTAWQTFGPTVITILRATVAGVMLFGDAMRTLQIGTQKAIGEIVDKIGWLVSKGGDILKKFGIDIVGDWGDTMQEWGKKTSDTADESWGKFRAESTAAWASVTRDAEAGARAATPPIAQIGAVATQALGTDVPVAAGKARAAIEANLGPTVQDLLGVTEQSMKDLAKTATMTLEPSKAQAFNGEMSHLITKSYEVRDQLMGWTPAIEKATGKGKDLAREVGTLARGALDAAQAFGVMDAEAAGLLNSVVNVAAALPRALGGDLGALGGVIGGVANIASKIVGGDAARQALLRDNTRNLDRLTKEVNGLRLGVTGSQFAGVQGALGSISGLLGKGFRFDVAGTDQLRQALFTRGLSFNDLDSVAKALGFNIRNKDGKLDGELLQQFFEGMSKTGPTNVGNTFDARLDQMLTGFNVRGTSGIAQLSSLFGLAASQGASALNGIFDPSNLAGTRSNLLSLFDRFESGGVSASELGGLTGQQFRDFIVDLITRTDGLLDNDGTSAPTGSAPLPGGEVVPTGGAPSPTLTLADVFRDYASDSLPLFTQQVELQTRIADATEATAGNTAATVDQLILLRSAIENGALVAGIDEQLARRRDLTALASGGGVSL